MGKVRNRPNEKLERFISQLRKKFRWNDELHIAYLGNYETIIISQKIVKKATISWFLGEK